MFLALVRLFVVLMGSLYSQGYLCQHLNAFLFKLISTKSSYYIYKVQKYPEILKGGNMDTNQMEKYYDTYRIQIYLARL